MALRACRADEVKAGSHGLVPSATTGELPERSHMAEHQAGVGIVRRGCRRPGAGDLPAQRVQQTSAESIELEVHAAKRRRRRAAWCHPLLQQAERNEGRLQHFQGIAEASSCRFIHLQHPPRSGRRHVGGRRGGALPATSQTIIVVKIGAKPANWPGCPRTAHGRGTDFVRSCRAKIFRRRSASMHMAASAAISDERQMWRQREGAESQEATLRGDFKPRRLTYAYPADAAAT